MLKAKALDILPYVKNRTIISHIELLNRQPQFIKKTHQNCRSIPATAI